MLDVHGPNAFPKKATRPGKDELIHTVHIQDIRAPALFDTEQTDVDLSKEDDDESMNSKDSGSSPRYTSGGEEDKANTPVSTPQMEATRSQSGMSMPSKITDFGYDTSPRTESGDNDELSQAGPN